jgi:purine-cytosine permease-like protein
MEDTPPGRRPAIASLIVRTVIFVALLLFVIVAYQRFPVPTLVLIPAMILTVVGIIWISNLVVKRRRAERLAKLRLIAPGATIIRTEWNATVLRDFVADRTLIAHTDPRGFVVEITADEHGLRFWRGAAGTVVLLGAVAWGDITGVETGEVKAAIGPRRVGTLKINFDRADTLSSPIELIVREESPTDAVTRVLEQKR